MQDHSKSNKATLKSILRPYEAIVLKRNETIEKFLDSQKNATNKEEISILEFKIQRELESYRDDSLRLDEKSMIYSGKFENDFEQYREKILSTEFPILRCIIALKNTKRMINIPTIDQTPKLYIGGKQKRPDSGYSFPFNSYSNEFICDITTSTF